MKTNLMNNEDNADNLFCIFFFYLDFWGYQNLYLLQSSNS